MTSKKLLDYYDSDKGRHIRRKSSLIEISHVTEIFNVVEQVLAKNKLVIKTECISCGRCRCGIHNDTYFVVEISHTIEPKIIREIEDALAKLDAKLIRIVARQEKGQTYIVLVILQLPYL
jgi:ribulose bisphosphate carboxylase small subunit